MTDDPNGAPRDEDLEPEAPAAAGEDVAGVGEAAPAEPLEGPVEESSDLDDAELEAASEAAEDEVEGDEGEDAILFGTAGVEAAPEVAPGQVRGEPEVLRRPRDRGPKPARTVFAVDPALRIKDPASQAFVLVSVAIFVGILAYALLFGHGGAFSPHPTATPVVTEAPSEVPSGGPSVAPSPLASPAASPVTSPAGSPGVSPASS